MPVAQGAHAVPFTHPNAAWTVTSSFPNWAVRSFIHSFLYALINNACCRVADFPLVVAVHPHAL